MENYQAEIPFNTSSSNVNPRVVSSPPAGDTHTGRIDFVRLRIRVIGTPNLQRITQENRLWSRDLRLTIPWQVLNVSVRWGDHHVGRGSEAMSFRYSTARFGVVTVVLAGDPKQCLPGIRNNAFPLFHGSVRCSDRRVGRGSEAMPSRYSTARCGRVWTVVLAGACRSFKAKKSEAMPSRYSTARFGVVTVVLAGDPKQCHPVIPRLGAVECGPLCWQEIRSDAFPLFHGSVRWSDRRVGRGSEAMPSRYSTARFGGVTVVLAGDPKQCLPIIPKCCISLCSRQIGLELATPEGVVVEALPRIRDKFYQEMSAACSIDPVADPQQLGSGIRSNAFPLFSSHRLHKSSTLASWNADFWGEVGVLLDFVRLRIRVIGTLNARARAFRSGPTQFFAEPCLYRINIDGSFYFQKI
ncbi:BQ5605_C032g11042 [Microbotryum silenes-dioicae]|uniref:BQ5605_C032g11042 protein n=1 Tax=Microbotryum silenes-dioicae TaxID=796604 RepID=A0A2X0MHD3_9BASI|nr:BQ5605_C032g11042 [Microbotryum silenes-dioicae]